MGIFRLMLLALSFNSFAADYTFEQISAIHPKFIQFTGLNNKTWSNHVLEWWYNPRNQPLTTEQSIEAISQATLAWQNISGITFVYRGITNQALSNQRDDKFVIGWLDSATFLSRFGDYSGYTHVWWFNDIVDGELSLNEADTAISSSVSELQGLVTHELGHALGLDHSDDPDSIMYTPYHSYAYQRILRTDDVNAARHLYPCSGCGDWFRIMNYAESAYADLFNSANQQTITLAPWVARFYPDSATYLGYNTNDSHFYILTQGIQPALPQQLPGTLAEYLDLAIQNGF